MSRSILEYRAPLHLGLPVPPTTAQGWDFICGRQQPSAWKLCYLKLQPARGSTRKRGTSTKARPRRWQGNKESSRKIKRERWGEGATEERDLSIFLLFYYKAGQPLGESAMPSRLAMRMMMLKLMVFDDDDGDEGLFLVIIWENKGCGHQPPTNSIF